MATDAQLSGPLPGSKFTQGMWSTHFGADNGIKGDFDGSAFGITLPPEGTNAEIGSPTVDSIIKVGGFPLHIPAGLTQSIEIPPSTNASAGRTDLVVARYDTAGFTTAPGPVRLDVVSGTEGSTSAPGYDFTLPTPTSMALWAVTRKLGQSLNQATVRDMRQWSGENYLVAASGELPRAAPLGSRATRDGTVYRRQMVGSAAAWVVELQPRTTLTHLAFTSNTFEGWTRQLEMRLVVGIDGDSLWVHIEVDKAGAQVTADSEGAIGSFTNLVTLNSAWKPPVSVSASGYVLSDGGQRRDAGGRINTDGLVTFTSTQPGAQIRTVVLDAHYSLA